MRLRLTRARVIRFKTKAYLKKRFRKKGTKAIVFQCNKLNVEYFWKAWASGYDKDDLHIHFYFYEGDVLSTDDTNDYSYSEDVNISINSTCHEVVIHEDDLTRHEKAIIFTLQLQGKQGL